jgi:hypothetical protein
LTAFKKDRTFTILTYSTFTFKKELIILALVLVVGFGDAAPFYLQAVVVTGVG